MGAYVEELFLLFFFYLKRYKYVYRNMKAAKLYRCAIREASHPKLIFTLRTYLIPGETLKTRQKEGWWAYRPGIGYASNFLILFVNFYG